MAKIILVNYNLCSKIFGNLSFGYIFKKRKNLGARDASALESLSSSRPLAPTADQINLSGLICEYLKKKSLTSWNHEHASCGENHGRLMNFEVHGAFDHKKYLTQELVTVVIIR